MFISLFLCLGAFFAGLVGGGLTADLSVYFWPWAALIFSLILRRYPRRRRFFLVLACFGFGWMRAQALVPVDLYLRNYFSTEAVWDFLVSTDPEPAWDKQITVLSPLPSSFSAQATTEKVIVNLPLYPRVVYGDRLLLRCRLEKPPVFADFDYAAYLAAQGIGATCAWPEIVSLEAGKDQKGKGQKLFGYKRRALAIINRSLPEPEAGLASALLLGYKKTLAPSENLNFQKAGLSHIVAISGGHISLFLDLLIGLFIYLGLNKRWAIWPALAAAGLYVFLTGVQASAWRSLLMGGLMLYAWRRGRLSSAWIPLLLAAAFMLIQNPRLWQYDLGFQLSFLALSGMIAFNPLFSELSERYCRRRWQKKFLLPLANAFNLSLSAQLTVWPLLALKSGGISLVAPLTNVLAFWIFGPLVLSLLAALGLSGLFGSAIIFWTPAYLLLAYLLKLGQISAALPGAYWETPGFKPIYAGLYYILLWFFWRRQTGKLKRKNKLIY